METADAAGRRVNGAAAAQGEAHPPERMVNHVRQGKGKRIAR